MDIVSDPDTSGDEVFSDVDSEEQDEMDEEEMDDQPHVNGDGGQHAPKRRKLGRTAREALHGVGDGIDHAEDAEASLLDLEVKELLEEASLSEDDAAVVHSIALQIASIVQTLPEAEVNPSPIAGLLSNFDFPLSRKFTFRPPKKVDIIGSFAIEGACLPSPCLDLAVVMPSSCFDDKDQLNHRYHAKRALYLSHIAATLQSKKIAKQLGIDTSRGFEWIPFRGDPRRHVLVIHLQQGSLSSSSSVEESKTITLRIIPVATPDLFPLQKLAPTRNNLRSICKESKQKPSATATSGSSGDKSTKINGDASPTPAASDVHSELLATPYYNAGILQDMLMLEHSKTLQKIAKNAPRLGEASILLRVWAQRHQLLNGADGVDGFFLTNLLAQLLQSGKASSGMSSMHLFRTTLMALYNSKTFAKDALSMQRSPLIGSSASGAGAPPPPPSWKSYRSASSSTPADTTTSTSLNEVIFLDSTGWLNLASYISSAALKQAQVCAQRTAALLSASAGPDAFDAAFLAGYPLASLYDVWYKVYTPSTILEKKDIELKSAEKRTTRTAKKKKETAAAAAAATVAEEGHGEGHSRALYYANDVPEWLQIDKKAAEIATKALGSRATLVRVIHRSAAASGNIDGTNTNGSYLSKPNREYTLIAARLDPTHALRGVDIGPAADSGAPAAQFRAFWGEKSELRRFQDGKISEAVVWEVSPSQRHTIVDNIIEYALQRHLSAGTRVSRCSNLLDSVLKRKFSTADDDVAATRLVEAAAARLGKRLRTLDGLPLQIVGTQPLAPVLRHAEVFPPQPHLLAGAPHNDLNSNTSLSDSIPRCLPAVELLCQLEGSGKWPDGPAAFAKMKAAVGVQIAQTLYSGFGIEAAAAEDFIDILTDGFAFRLILHTERDIAMQQMALTASGMPHLPPEEDVALRMWHHGAISAAAATNPAFEPSVRLAKRWIASQWLSPHFRDEAIELLVAAAFAAGNSVVAPPPGSRISGFLRFLHVLGNHPWTAAPLVGDIAAGDPGPRRGEVAARAHAAQRSAEMAPAMFITGPKDNECVGWTRDHPTKPMLHRAAVLARRAMQTLENALISENEEESEKIEASVLESLFIHDEGEYEVIIRLRPDALPKHDMVLTKNTGKNATKNKKSGRGGGGGIDIGEGWSVVEPEDSLEESKKSRAVLKGIPKTVVELRGAAAVRKELLVEFDPVPLYVSLLEDRFGSVAVPCADYLGGTSIGLKLRGPVLQPAGNVRPEAAHALKPLVVPKSFDDALVVGPDVEAVAADALALGKGLVERVEFRNL